VTGALEITQADVDPGDVDQARWRRQAVRELALILDAHAGLPAIAWTVGPAGCLLAGRVNGLASAARVLEAFTAWRVALSLEDRWEHAGVVGTVYLHAEARRGGVKVRVTATVFEAEEDQ
jgi:hypothetical protein